MCSHSSMTTLIEQFGVMLKQIPGVYVEFRLAELLVTVPLGNGRRQTVKVSSHRGTRGPYNVLRIISRACIARDPKIVNRALRANAGNELGGIALDPHCDPPILDVVYNIIADDLPANTLINSVYRVADFADRIENSVE